MTDKYTRDSPEIKNHEDYYISSYSSQFVAELMNYAYEEGKIDALKKVDELADGVYLTTRLIDFLNSELKK